MAKKIRIMLACATILALAVAGGCLPRKVASIDFTEEGYESQVEIEEDDTANVGSASVSGVPPNYYKWENQHGLVLRRGRIYTNDAYLGNFRAVLKVNIVLDEAGAPLGASDGFILGIGFKEQSDAIIPSFFKAVQFYGNHTDLTGSIEAYTVVPHMLYDTAVSLVDPEIDYVAPYVTELMPGLVIGASMEEGENTIILDRTGGTIEVRVNGRLVGVYESEYLLPQYDDSVNLVFDNLNTELPVRIGVFSACAHIDGSTDEGVFLQSLDIYADEVVAK